ncbi:MAG: permease [Treponema sp.]|nr:permease [Treponema sp.]
MISYITPVILLFNEMSPYLLAGFLFAGFLKAFIPNEKYIGFIAKSDFRSVLWATFAGIPLPLCSCGVIPTAISLHKEGASKGAAISFLTSAPQTNIQSIMATYSLLGLPFAVIRPLAAFISSLMGGLLVNKFQKNTPKDETAGKCNKEDKKQKNKIIQIFHYGFVELLQDIGKWLIIGIIIAGLLVVFLPDDLFSAYLSNPILNMLIVLVIALPSYTCTMGAIPMAAVLMMKGLSAGAAFVFLLAGPVTSIATMTVIGKTLGKRTLIIYLLNIVINALLFGLVIDYLLPAAWFDMSIITDNLLCDSGIKEFSLFKTICSVVLAGLLINAFIQKLLVSKKKTDSSACCCADKEENL